MIQNFYKKHQQTWLFYHYFFLLFGFLGGNLWGSFFSSFDLPPFFFVIGILLCLEILSYIYYKKITFPSRGLPFDAQKFRRAQKATPFRALLTLGLTFWARVLSKGTRVSSKTQSLVSYEQKGPAFQVKHPNVEQVNQTTQKKKNFSTSNGFLAFSFIDFQFIKTKTLSKKKTEFTNNLYHKLNFVQSRNKSLYLLKVGLVFGLFVDAFKVGS